MLHPIALALALVVGPGFPQEKDGKDAPREWIPMELHLGRMLFLRGRANGSETDLVLDSAAGMTLVDAHAAERLGFGAGKGAADLARGWPSPSLVEGLRIQIGAQRLELPRALRVDLTGVAAQLGRDVPVILGAELFERFVVDVDYPNGRLALREPEGFAYAGPGHTVALRRDDGRHVVAASVEDRPPANFVLDTGSRALELFPGYTTQEKLLAGRAPTSARPSTSSAATWHLATLRSFTFAGYRLENVPAELSSPLEAGALDGEHVAGSLGAVVLARFRLIFDRSRAELHVEPAADWETRPFSKDRLGLSCSFRGQDLEVVFVAPGSPAESSGWKPGQHIRAIQGEAVSATTWRKALARWAEASAGTEVNLTDAEGRVRRVVAAEYY